MGFRTLVIGAIKAVGLRESVERDSLDWGKEGSQPKEPEQQKFGDLGSDDNLPSRTK